MSADGSQFLVSSQPVIKIDGQAIGGQEPITISLSG